MSLKTFLQEKGFIEKDKAEDKKENVTSASTAQVAPTYFPIHDSATTGTSSSTTNSITSTAEAIDPAFIKFFEDELARINLPGPDYFEFRRQMIAMHQKIGKKGTSPEIILQAVLTSFEAMNVSNSNIVTTAKQYREALEKKKTDFLKGAGAEKDKQLKKRQDALQMHQDNLNQMQNQLLQLQNQMNQLQDMIKREQTQMEVDKTLGKEGIEKIERAEKQISMAYEFMVSSIESDIKQLQSA
jgi:peptidoglycan hydrolase CwlO-like protein